MLISTQQELRILIPSHAVDSVEIFQGIIDNSEKDVLKDKLGNALYDRLCAYYKDIDANDYFQSVIDGTYSKDPWSELLLNAQRIIVNDALARFAYQQVISINGTGVNVVSGNDYGNADDRLLERGVSGYRKEAAIAINNLLILLEEWAKSSAVAPGATETTVPDASATVSDASLSGDTATVPDESSSVQEIVTLWQQSKYYYLHADLLIPTAHVLQHYLDIYENRDKFIRLLPDLRFIQDEYIEDAFGEDFVKELLSTETGADAPQARLLRKTRRLIVAYLEQRTQVLPIEKNRRLQAHDEAISLKAQILATLKTEASSDTPKEDGVSTPPSSSPQAYQNNQQGSRIFVSPLIY